MWKSAILGALILIPATALAQDAPSHAGVHNLPKACQDASPGHDMMGGDMKMEHKGPHAASAMGDQRMAGMKAMHDMDAGMRAADGIKDPDLSFVCGMIAHHRGAVAMSEIALRSGRDEQVKAWAKKIIEDQEREIAQFEAWAAKANTPK